MARFWERRRGSGAGAAPQPWEIPVIGLLLVAAGIVLISAVIDIWPLVQKAPAAKDATKEHAVHFAFGLFTLHLTTEAGLLVLAIVAGALGAYVHAATSFGDFVGNREFVRSWGWWYGLRIFIGSSLALLIYFAVRGGFFTGNASSQDVNPYGIAAFSGLAGLFSKRASDKLKEVFETMFKVSPEAGDAQRKNSLGGDTPIIKSTDPKEGVVNHPLSLVIKGEGFVDGSGVKVGDSTLKAAFDADTKDLKVNLPADLVKGDKLILQVVNPEPHKLTSEPFVVPLRPA